MRFEISRRLLAEPGTTTLRAAVAALTLAIAATALRSGVAQDAAPDASPAATASPAPEATSAPQATPPPETPEETLRKRIEETERRVAELEGPPAEGTPEPTPDDVAFRDARIRSLRELAGILQRRVTALQRLDARRKSMADLAREVENFDRVGFADPPPYRMAKLDGLRDRLAATEREDETLARAVANAAEESKNARSRLEKAEQARRQARAELDAAGENPAPALARRVELASLEEACARADVELRETQTEAAELEAELGRRETEFLRTQVAALADRVVFARDELDERKADVAARRADLERKLRDAARNHEENEKFRERARDEFEKARTEEEIAEKTALRERRDAWALTSGRAVELLEKRIANLAIEETLVERRYLASIGTDDLRLLEWEKETKETIDSLAKDRGVVESRIADARAASADLEKSLAERDPARGPDPHGRSRLEALAGRIEISSEYVASVVALERLAARLLEEIRDARSVVTWEDRLLHVKARVESFLSRELFVVDDRPIQAGTLIRAALIFFGSLAFSLSALRVAKRSIARRLRRDAATVSAEASLPLALVEKTRGILLVMVAAWLATLPLPLSPEAADRLTALPVVAMLLQVALWANETLLHWIQRTKRLREAADPSTASAMGAVSFFGRVALWGVVGLLVLSNLGFDVSAVVAGFGIGGIAVAFALQNILGDVFCSVAILLDKPFVVGDFIVVGAEAGNVEQIGIKTTHLRSLDGELIVFPNADLIGSRVRNYKRMYRRRVLFQFGIAYETPPEKVERIPELVVEIVEDVENCECDRVHFQSFGDSALIFEVVYYVAPPDYNLHMDRRQEIHLRLLRKFREEGVEFAYPTQTLYLKRETAAER